MTAPHDDVGQWNKILHAALKSGNRDDAMVAFEHIATLNRAGNVGDTMQSSAEEDARSPLSKAADVPLAAGLGAAQGATLGFAGRIPMVKRALAGAKDAEPLAETVGDMAGSLLLPGNILPSKGFGIAKSFAKPVLKLAAQGVATGGTMGAIRGANEAEEGHRGEGALVGGAKGAAYGLIPAGLKTLGAAPRALASKIDKAWPTDELGLEVAPTMRQKVVNWGKSGMSAPTEAAPAKPRTPMTPGQAKRFEQAFGKKAHNAPVIDPPVEPTSGPKGTPMKAPPTKLLPQDEWSSNKDLKDLLMMGEDEGMTQDYRDAVVDELARRLNLK